MNGRHLFVLGLFLSVVTKACCKFGGLEPQEFAGPGEQALVSKNRNAIIRMLPSYVDRPIGQLTALVFRKQGVLVTTYYIKVRIGKRRPRFIHVRIFAGRNNRSKVQAVRIVNQYDPIVYFE